MIEVMEVVTDYAPELVGSGFDFLGKFNEIKTTVEMVATNPKILWAVFTFLWLYHRASLINAREELIAELKLDDEQKIKLKAFIDKKTKKLENIAWHGLDKYRNALEDNGINTVKINHGNDKLEGKPVSDIKRDYHHAFGKEAIFLGDRLLTEILDKDKSIKDGDSREKFILNLADGEREILLSKTHKRAGYNEGLEEMEEDNMPFELVRDIVSDIVEHAETLEGVKLNDIKSIRKNFRINPLFVVKILSTIVGNIRERRWKRKAQKKVDTSV